jgi:hypothetical protein
VNCWSNTCQSTDPTSINPPFQTSKAIIGGKSKLSVYINRIQLLGNMYYISACHLCRLLNYILEGPKINPRWCHWGFFTWHSTIPCARGQLSLLKMSTRIPLGVKSRCVWLTTYHLQVPMSRNLEALTSQNPLHPIGL